MPESTLAVTRIAGALGAEIRGIDLAKIDADGARQVERLLWEHQVLFFPDQHPSVDEHVAFGEHFGELEGHPHLANPETEHEKIFELAASHGGIADDHGVASLGSPGPPLATLQKRKDSLSMAIVPGSIKLAGVGLKTCENMPRPFNWSPWQ